MAQRCGQWVNDGRIGYPCPREAVEDGMCKLHLAGAKRRKANDEKRAAERLAEDEHRRLIDAQIAELAKLGIRAHVHTANFRATGRVIVDPDQVLSLLARSDA